MWVGPTCELPAEDYACDPSCQNSGDCIIGSNDTHSCICPPGYSGTHCETYDDPGAIDNCPGETSPARQ